MLLKYLPSSSFTGQNLEGQVEMPTVSDTVIHRRTMGCDVPKKRRPFLSRRT